MPYMDPMAITFICNFCHHRKNIHSACVVQHLALDHGSDIEHANRTMDNENGR